MVQAADFMSVRHVTPGIACKRCHSGRIIKRGRFLGSQRYQCKDCGCVFVDNQAPLRGRLPVEAVVTVMEHFFAGEPLDSIRILIEDSPGVSVTVAGLEKVVSRFARKAVRIAGDIVPPVHSRWLLEGAVLPGAQPVCILDVLDLDSGFIIASDLITPFRERDRASVVRKALQVTGSTPEMIILGTALSLDFLDKGQITRLAEISFTPRQASVLQTYEELKNTRTLLLSRRLNFDSITNNRLFCAAWRVHYNFLGDCKPAGRSQFNSWMDIVNAADYFL